MGYSHYTGLTVIVQRVHLIFNCFSLFRLHASKRNFVPYNSIGNERINSVFNPNEILTSFGYDISFWYISYTENKFLGLKEENHVRQEPIKCLTLSRTILSCECNTNLPCQQIDLSYKAGRYFLSRKDRSNSVQLSVGRVRVYSGTKLIPE